MGSFMKDMKHNYFISTIITIAIGLVLVIWPDLSGRLLCYTLGAAIILMGIVQLIVFWRGERIGIVSKFTMFMSIILILLGIWVCTSPQTVLSLIPIVIGIVMVMHGIMDIQYTLDIKNTGAQRWWIALLAAVLTLIGGMVLIFNAYLAFQMTFVLIGVVLLFDGFSDLALILIAAYRQKQSDKRIRDFHPGGRGGNK